MGDAGALGPGAGVGGAGGWAEASDELSTGPWFVS
jgi:hypothetical protein